MAARRWALLGDGATQRGRELEEVGKVEEGVVELAGYPNGTMMGYWRRARGSAPMVATVADLGRSELALRGEREKGKWRGDGAFLD
jgi:hypothetical protein